MKIYIDKTNLYLKNNVKPITKWHKDGPRLYLQKYYYYDIDALIGTEDGLLEFLYDLEFRIENKTHLLQLKEIIDYVKSK